MEKSSFEAHPMWAAVGELDDALSQAEAKDDPTIGPALGDLRYLVSLIRSHAEPTDAAPYSATGLNAVNSNLPNVTSEVNNFISNGNASHMATAANYADTVLNQIGSWPTLSLKGGAAAMANRLFTEYRDAADEAATALRESNRALREQLSSQKAENDAAVEALKSEIAQLTAKITADEARLDTALTTNNEAFTAKQTEREERFKAFIKDQGEALTAIADDDLTAMKDLVTQARTTYGEIDGLREGTEKVAGLASADILAGKFKEYSDQQWKWGVGANALGFLALAAGLVVIGWTLHSVGATEKISWQYTTLKLGVTITIVAASAVAFRLGGIFLSRSSTNKRMELELRAIGPFFADIDDPEALKDAKKAFVERSFGRGWAGKHGDSDGQLSVNDATTLLKEVLAVVKTVTTRT